MVSVFLCLLQFLSYDVIMSDADCTPSCERRSVAASFKMKVVTVTSGMYLVEQFVIVGQVSVVDYPVQVAW